MDDAVQVTPDGPIDPDLEVILSLLQGALVPPVSVLNGLVNQPPGGQDRDLWADSRHVRVTLFQIEDHLGEAENLLRGTHDLVREHNRQRHSLWPAGTNGLRLTEEAFARYMAIVEHGCKVIQRIDDNSMRLSGYAHVLYGAALVSSAAPTQWQMDLYNARIQQEKVYQAHTYGEKTRALNHAFRMCRSVLVTFHRVLAEKEDPQSVRPRRAR